MKFTEAQLEQAFIDLLGEREHEHRKGEQIIRSADEVLWLDELRSYLQNRYAKEMISTDEVEGIIRKLQALPASDLYESNKSFMQWIRDGFVLKREDRSQKDLFIQLIDFEKPEYFEGFWDFYDIHYTTQAYLKGFTNKAIKMNILHNSAGELAGRDSWHKNREAFIANTDLPMVLEP